MNGWIVKYSHTIDSFMVKVFIGINNNIILSQKFKVLNVLNVLDVSTKQ
jgi:hypothetical protein